MSAFQVVSGVCYVSTYESVRHILDKQGIVTDNKIKAFVGKKPVNYFKNITFFRRYYKATFLQRDNVLTARYL